MMSLFNSFDMIFFSNQLIFLTLFVSLFLLSLHKISMYSAFTDYLMEIIFNFFESIKPNSFSMMFKVMIFILMGLIFLINVTSILPFNFPFSSQLSVVVSISFSFWLSFLFFQLIFGLKSFLYHCVPEGTPIYLTWFLFVIEITSNMIRPITLTVRLVANILAGHLLMILLSKVVLKLSISMIFFMLLNLVEMFVSAIQAYIFSVMVCLYYSDVK